MEVGKLVAALSVLHWGFGFDLVGELVEDERHVRNHSSNFVLLQLAPDHVDLVLCLNAGEATRHQFSVLDSDGRRILRLKFMNQHLLQRVVIVVKSRLLSLQDEIRFEGKHIMQEAPKLIDFAPHIDLRPSVVRAKVVVVGQLRAKLIQLGLVVLQEILLLQNVEKLARGVHRLLL